SGAWAKGANKAVSSAPPDGGFTTVGGGKPSSLAAAAAAGGGGRGSSSSNYRKSQSGRGGSNNASSNNNNNRRTSTNANGYHNNNNKTDGDSPGRGGRGGGRGRSGNRGSGRGGRGRNSQDHRNSTSGGGRGGKRDSVASNASGNNYQGRTERIIIKDVKLLEPGMGKTAEQKSVKRIGAKDFILLRTQYLESDPNNFQPHDECHWISDDRADIIQALCSRVMELGDVSKNTSKKIDTAPPLEDCAPLEKNEETRWKSKAMKGDAEVDDSKEPETEEEIVAKATLILNKISWTTMDRLTAKFVEQTNLKENEAVRGKCIALLIKKAQMEQHFGPMYAQLCSIISKGFKPFKKELLLQCQKEFEIDTAHKIENATQGITDPEEIEYHSTLIRKAYIGHMTFLGELYLRDVVKLAVMMHCLDELLKDETDDENIECFAHLMTTMGQKLEDHAIQNNKPFDWDKVDQLRSSPNIHNRVKFLLQDLLELKNRGWVQRRKTETAKSLHDLHKDLAKEEKQAKRDSKMGNIRASSTSQSNLKRATSLASAAAAATPDEDGFTQIKRGSMKKVGSGKNFAPPSPQLPGRPTSDIRRASSQPIGMDYDAAPSPSRPKDLFSGKASVAPSLPSITSPPPAKASVLSPDECGEKMKNILKEYFIGGDTADAVLSVQEIVQVGVDGSVERGAKMIEGGTLMVMEMKETEVQKFVTVLESCVKEEKIEKDAVVQGLNDPLEFLSDIEIDAPLAGNHLALIVSELLKWNAIDFGFLAAAPEYFRTDGKPAAFAIKVLKKRGGEPLDDDFMVIGALMTEDDRKAYESPKAMFDA
ncbi:MAG: hypothetical protein SGILL_006676, partial [Bacillariaceae sp.]